MALYRRSSIAGGLLAAALCGFLPAAAALELEGRIQVSAPYPKPINIKVSIPGVGSRSGEQVSDQLLISAEGGLKNAVIYFLERDSSQGQAESLDSREFQSSNEMNPIAVLDQKDYHFEPHVLIAFPGQRIVIKNSDPQAHDVRLFNGPRMVLRTDMGAGVQPFETKLDEPGFFTVRCGVHRWMYAYVIRAANPFYAKTDAQGGFSIRGFKKGNYKIRIWHEEFGFVDQTLIANESVRNFLYTFQSKRDS